MTIHPGHQPQGEPGEIEVMRAKLSGVVSHATGGALQDPDLGLNAICVEITRHQNKVFTAGRDAATIRSEIDQCITAFRLIQDKGDSRANAIATQALRRLEACGFIAATNCIGKSDEA